MTSNLLIENRAEPSRGPSAPVVNPAPGEIIVSPADAAPDQVDRAVRAAQAAFPSRPRATLGERSVRVPNIL